MTVSELATAAEPCALHRDHSPTHLTIERHHIVPVGWQLTWQPPKPWPYEGRDPEGRGLLWDARSAWLCPTGHRNVHAFIVAGMYELAGRPAASLPSSRLTHQMASWALAWFVSAGGDPQVLIAAGEWGEA